MLNMLDTQDNLKNFSEDQLVREMQAPSGSAPQFMVLGEIERRKRMRADSQRQQGLMQPTVAQEGHDTEHRRAERTSSGTPRTT